MDFLQSLQFLGPMQDHISRFYSTASDIIIVLLCLWAINFIVGLIQKTYATGKAIGNFYRSYLHNIFSSSVTNLLKLFRKNNTNIESPQVKAGQVT